ncbi:MAG: DNA cytosine methyltransferase [Methanobacteriota archaeon]
MDVIDLFCGAGGSTLGAKLAGHRVTHAYDRNPTFLKSYRANHPEVETHCIDILDLKASDLSDADILMGSTPCESFSRANIHGRACDMTLTNHFLKLVAEYNPKYWVMENVPEVAKFLNGSGTPCRILCTADFGVPQRRKRLMAGNYPEPVMTHRFEDLSSHIPFGNIKDTNKDNWSILSKKAIEGVYRRVHEMGLKGHGFKVHFVDDKTVLHTITASESHGVRTGSQIIYDGGVLRRLTYIECIRAQSFPDDYIFCGTLAERYKQIGQAVPSLLMKAILTGI